MATDEHKQVLFDIFTTAIEGGINYWSSVREYHWQNENNDDLDGFYALIEDEDGNPYRIDHTVISRGLRAIITKRVPVAEWIQQPLAEFVRSHGEDGDYDAIGADCVVQAGLWGKVIYG